jgi:hypothetical protein
VHGRAVRHAQRLVGHPSQCGSHHVHDEYLDPAEQHALVDVPLGVRLERLGLELR